MFLLVLFALGIAIHLYVFSEDDQERTVQCCEWFIGKYEDDTFPYIFRTNETTFELNGRVNQHNNVDWEDSKSHEIIEKEVNTPGVCVWVANLCNTTSLTLLFVSRNRNTRKLCGDA